MAIDLFVTVTFAVESSIYVPLYELLYIFTERRISGVASPDICGCDARKKCVNGTYAYIYKNAIKIDKTSRCLYLYTLRLDDSL
jgi:hypothetical protein